MLNGEKYKDLIVDAANDTVIDDPICELHKARTLSYDCDHDCDTCKRNALKWLVQEYKEPILTNEEKPIIEDIIKAFEPFGKKVEILKKDRDLNHIYEYFLFIECGDCNGNNGIPDNADTPSFSSELFAGMELGRAYTLEELGLC